MKTKVVNTILLGALSAFPMFGGCSSAETPKIPGAEQTGGLDLDLQIGFGVTINTVSYTITGPLGFNRAGSIDVTNSSIVSALIGGIPLGVGYQIVLSAKTVDGKGTCGGSASPTRTFRPMAS